MIHVSAIPKEAEYTRNINIPGQISLFYTYNRQSCCWKLQAKIIRLAPFSSFVSHSDTIYLP